MDDPNSPHSLDEIASRLRAAREREARTLGQAPEQRARVSGIGVGMRIGVELVASVAVGVLIGLGLDAWLGTRPWLMVLFLLLGGAAGVMNVYRFMRNMDDAVGFERARQQASAKQNESEE